ncbi:MAG: LysR family transcriptional regulator [Lachnospiraceae bacterium]|nr:LysR family transcriptional regulator [Lachnospiraceae bacterium]
MNLKHLKTFLTLTEEKSFTKTASTLNCAQSGVTAQIKALEEELGVQLFERMGKNVTLTAEGKRLVPYAIKMLNLSAEIDTLYQNFSRLTIGITDSIATYLFGDILKEYTALCPDAEIFLKIIGDFDYCQMLRDGEIDLAIVLDIPVKNKHIQVLQKRKENIALFAASTHALSGKHSVTTEDFKTHAMLLPPSNCPYRQLLEQKLHTEGIRPKIALETDSASIIKESSLSGIGIGLLPEFAIKKELIYHMFEKINYKMDYPIYTQILMHQDKWISKNLAQFIDVAKRHLL